MDGKSSKTKQISVGLFGVLSAATSDPQRTKPPTLAEVRAALMQSGTQWSPEGELLHPQDRTSLVIELDELIREYGAAFSAREIIQARGG